MPELHTLTIKDAHDGLTKKDFSATELVDAFFRRIKTHDAGINSFLSLNEDESRAQAKATDGKIAQKEQIGPLEGVPLAVKDVICVRGTKTTAGSKILENYVAPYDATVIERLRSAGAIFLGKTNCDEFAMGSSNESSAYGVVRNPRDHERVPGGSSGGSAAAVAADFCVAALGSDTGGSIRQPASFCGIVGLKPTYGRVSRYGLIAMASSFDQIGPITKTVDDAATLLSVIAGRDQQDATSADRPPALSLRAERSHPTGDPPQGDNLKGLRIGIPREYFGTGLDRGVEKTVRIAIKKLEDLGAKTVEVHLPDPAHGLAIYYILMPAEVSANLSRFDGIRYGKRVKAENLLETYMQSRGQGFGAEVRRRIMLGTYVLSSGYYDAYYAKAQKVRTLVRRGFDEVFAKVDCIVAPTSPVVAWKIGELADDPLAMYLMDIYTVTANVAGIPAISIPCGESDGLPVGLQIMGKMWDEETILKVASAYENAV